MEVNEIEVIDVEIVSKECEVEKFYKWMESFQNKFLFNDEKMERAYNIVLK